MPAGNGLVEVAHAGQSATALAVNVGVFGIRIQGAFQIGKLAVVELQLFAGRAHRQQSRYIPGIELEHLQASGQHAKPVS